LETQVFRPTLWSRVVTVFWSVVGGLFLGFLVFVAYWWVEPAGTTSDLLWRAAIGAVPAVVIVGGLLMAVFGDQVRFEVQGSSFRKWNKDELVVQVGDVNWYVGTHSQHVDDGTVMNQALHLMPLDGSAQVLDVDCTALSSDQFEQMLDLLHSRGLKKIIPALN